MIVQIRSDGIIVAELPGGSETSEALDSVVRRVLGRDDCDVVIDFSRVTMVTSRSLAPLLHLRELLRYHKKRLLLCGIGQVTKGVFSVTALDGVFETADDKDRALAALQAPASSPIAVRNDSLHVNI
jgi:anti-anti-sigma factor